MSEPSNRDSLPPMDVMIAAVRKHECSTRGHSWDVIEGLGYPVRVVCSNCGEDSGLIRPSAQNAHSPSHD